jgi:coenzyme F420-reducing hydrogenase beta subunit
MSIRQVIDGGYCIGCGACRSVLPGTRIKFNRYGDLVAQLPNDVDEAALASADAVCPFSDGEDEDSIATSLFVDQRTRHHPEIGLHMGCFAAYAPTTRERGSSGGVATWLLCSLLEGGLIDQAVHVGPSWGRDDDRFFSFRISHTREQIHSGATSFYYPVSMDEALEHIRRTPGRYAITAVPCFNKALRRLRARDPVLNSRIAFQIGIVCGQMKSAHYLEYLTQLAGGDSKPREACFRRKLPGHRADDYAFEATVAAVDGRPRRVSILNTRVGVNWGMGYFKPLACDYCDDVLAETADIAVMDAWLPPYIGDGLGWSFVVTRHPALDGWLRNAGELREVVLKIIDADTVAQSQRGGLNHRRDALPFRLWLGRGYWQPTKRARPSSRLHWVLKLEQWLRMHLRRRSRQLWLTTGHRGDLAAFQRGMKLSELLYRLLSKIKRLIR